jgi:hypothetical protein
MKKGRPQKQHVIEDGMLELVVSACHKQRNFMMNLQIA